MSEPFDFEAFIAGAHLAEDTFALYLVNHGPAIARLQAEIEQATGADEREYALPGVAELEQQAARLTAEMQASKREVTLRAMTPDEIDQAAKPEVDLYGQLAMQSVKPNLTAEQWKRLGAAIGAQQFAELMQKANALATLQVVVPDFSPSTSSIQNQRESSLS